MVLLRVKRGVAKNVIPAQVGIHANVGSMTF